MSIQNEIIEALGQHGIITQAHFTIDGKLHRFHVEGDKPGTKNGWYVAFNLIDDAVVVTFGCWKRGISETWCSKSSKEFTPEQKALYRKHMEEVRQKRAEKQKRVHAQCRKLSTEIFSAAEPATSQNPYLRTKGVQPFGVKALGDTLVVPVRNSDGELHGLQFITADGTKKYKTGTAKTGNYHAIGKAREDTLLVCEGYASGASIHEATGHGVAVAFDAGNLKHVALELRGKYPAHKLIICADNDSATAGNPGLTKATEAAQAVDGYIAVPQFILNNEEGAIKGIANPTDFNDLHILQGLTAVRSQIEKAKPVPNTASGLKSCLEPQPLVRAVAKGEDFPVDCLPANMKRAVLRVEEVVQAPLSIICQSFLAAATLAAQPHADIVNDGRVKPISNIFITVGASGERKSACDDIANLPIKEKQRRLKLQSVENRFQVEAEYAAWKKTREQILKNKQYETKEAKEQALIELGEPPEIIDPMILTEEPTFEGLVKALVHGQPSMGIYSDEGGQFLGGYAMSTEHQKRTISGLSKLWDGAPITRTRSDDGNQLIYGRRLSMHIMIQPIIASQVFSNPLMSGQGFLSRCLCSHPESNIGNRPYVSVNLVEDAAMAGYLENMKYLMDLPLPLHNQKEMGLEPRHLTLSASAKRLWIGFHDHVEMLQKDGQPFFPIKGFASKAAEHALRIAAVLSVYTDPETTEVMQEQIAAGIEIVQFYLGETLRLFHASTDDPDLLLAQKVLQWAQQHGSLLALIDLYQSGPNAVRDKKKALRMIEILEDHNWARRIQKGCDVNGKFRRDVWEVRNGALS